MEKKLNALVAGGTGLIGKELCRILASDNYYDKVISLVRRKSNQVSGVTEQVVNFDTLSNTTIETEIDVAFCCLGTTMKKAGSKEAFYKVDYEYVEKFAKLAHALGVEKFLLVTAIGADANSMFYYNRVKGEIENTIKAIPFKSIHIFRPSLLIGDREEQRTGEDVGKFVYKHLDFLIPKKYKGIEGSQVAKAMAQKGKSNIEDVLIYESKVIQELV
ncbi:oxidoreductase [Chondrinema litorale]|uniref:oxidoreductase n=1 Tax=Chondrinema litorale TaxID=2994555 RepID=UPI002543354B|nr:oxidoreductase [Chondrinema litorale]UZR94931.1 oxidoreductase [Chondrinema litorale]